MSWCFSEKEPTAAGRLARLFLVVGCSWKANTNRGGMMEMRVSAISTLSAAARRTCFCRARTAQGRVWRWREI